LKTEEFLIPAVVALVVAAVLDVVRLGPSHDHVAMKKGLDTAADDNDA